MNEDLSRRDQIKARHAERRGVRLACVCIFLVFSTVYLIWRITIFNPDAPVLSALFFGAECVGFLLALCTIFLSWGVSERRPGPVPTNAVIDVLVPTYQEPIDVIRRTLEAAVDITYPHKTLVLDDGHRPEVRDLAELLGCEYHSRPKNEYAKAGNLNFGFSKSDAEFLMVFDADHIPQPHAIDVLLGYFDDPRVGLVQTPQDFYNTSSLQFVNAPNGGLWHDQSYFYSIILPNADRFDGAICVGTGVIYRRSAVEAIGGIPVDTVTEDLHTSLRMHKAGLASVYHPEPIAYGIGESKLSDYYKVRLRWGHGNIHALRHENVLFCRGLSFRQRLNYLFVGLNYLEGWQYLVFYLIPIYSLLTGVPPFEITYFNLMVIIAFPILNYLLVQEFACGLGRFWVNEVYSMIRFPVALRATAAVLRNRTKWRPSAKMQNGRIEWQMMAPQLTVVCLSLAAILYAMGRVWNEPVSGGLSQLMAQPGLASSIDWTQEIKAGYSLDLLLVAGFWALLNVIRGALFVIKIVRAAQQTHADHRFHVPLIVEADLDGTSQTFEVSELSLSFLRLKPSQQDGLPSVHDDVRLFLPGEVVRLKLDRSEEGQGAYTYTFVDDSERRALEVALYSVGWHRKLFHHEAEFVTPLAYLMRLIGLRGPMLDRADWRPELARLEDGTKALRYRNHAPGRREELVTFPSSPGRSKPILTPRGDVADPSRSAITGQTARA